MTNQDYSQYDYPCEYCRAIGCYSNCDELNEWIEKAKIAIGRVYIPKMIYKTKYIDEKKRTSRGICMVCGTNFNSQQNYCSRCGQKLGWPEVE